MSEKPLAVGDLPAAAAVVDTDTSPICQAPNGCFANDATVTLKGVTQRQLVTYYRTQFGGTAPITYDLVTGKYGLAIDSSLLVVDGLLGVAATGNGGGGVELTVAPPLHLSGNELFLLYDPATLAVVGGRLTVIGGGPPPTTTGGGISAGGGGTLSPGGGGVVSPGGEASMRALEQQVADLTARIAVLEAKEP